VPSRALDGKRRRAPGARGKRCVARETHRRALSVAVRRRDGAVAGAGEGVAPTLPGFAGAAPAVLAFRPREERPMPSFDVVSEVNQVEVRNAVDQANKEVSTRFDFKGSDARIELADKVLTLYADDEFKLKQVTDILTAKLAKRGVDTRCLKAADPDKVSGNKVKQVVTVRTGIEQELAKKIQRTLKDSKLRIQASIQGDAVRVSGAKKDDLQAAIALVRKTVTDFPVQVQNFRD
jgi:uncharacterized protein YajQ (UPF0234 family)